MAETGIQYPNFKDAYCAAHRCPPEGFERHVFSRAVYRLTLPLASLFGLGNRNLFGPDYEVIMAIGAATSLNELQLLLDEFENRRLVERSFRRQTLRIRTSVLRLDRLFRPLAAQVTPPAVVASPIAAPAAPRTRPTADRSTPREPAGGAPAGQGGEAREAGNLVVRRLRRLHTEIVEGRPLAQAASRAGFSIEEIPAALAEHKDGFADLIWLESHLAQRDEVLRLQKENEQLRRVVADLSDRLLTATGRV